MNEEADFAVKVLKQYALENFVPTRSTSDISPMEEWLILRLFTVTKLLPEDYTDKLKAMGMDEKDFNTNFSTISDKIKNNDDYLESLFLEIYKDYMFEDELEKADIMNAFESGFRKCMDLLSNKND